jgi:hypothetical protein
MPIDETLTGLENLCIEAARITIKKNGGQVDLEPSPSGRGQGEGVSKSLPRARRYLVPIEQPANIEPLATPADQLARIRKQFGPQLKTDLASPGASRARAAFIAICLGETEKLKREAPKVWAAAVADLQVNYPKVVHNLFKAPAPIGDPLQHAAEQAGLNDPKDLKLTERPLEDK